MAENKENDERKTQIAEVNRHIRDGINQWADIMLTADADQWAYDLTYFPRDLMNATLIYQHVASNIGIKAGRIDEERAVEFGQRLRQLVIDMTGYDPHEFWKDPKTLSHMSKRRIYLSGGMSGVERAEYVRRFGEAEAILRRHGYGVINPCRVWACRWPWIYRAMEWVLGKRWAYAVVLCYDLLLLMTRADGIAMLPGWEGSRGARIENYVARHFPMMGIARQAAEEIGKIK